MHSVSRGSPNDVSLSFSDKAGARRYPRLRAATTKNDDQPGSYPVVE
jgi:hypothetical protein